MRDPLEDSAGLTAIAKLRYTRVLQLASQCMNDVLESNDDTLDIYNGISILLNGNGTL